MKYGTISTSRGKKAESKLKRKASRCSIHGNRYIEIPYLLMEIQRKGTTILLVTHDPKVAAKSERVLFMLDGKIVGEYKSGPYDEANGDLKAREEKLSAWLVDMKF